MVLGIFVSSIGEGLTPDLSAWYASGTIVFIAIVLVLALWSLRNALGGRKVWGGEFLEK